MATIRQLAKLAEVSIATVSLALRDDPRIRPATRARIQALAQQYNYRPNRLMQGVLSGRSGSLGLVIPDVTLPFRARILSGVLAQAFTASYTTSVLETHGDPPHSLQALHTLIDMRVDGIIIESGHASPIPPEAMLTVRSHDVPLVVLDITVVGTPVDRICTDEERLAEIAISHLQRLGHRAIAYVGPQTAQHPRWMAMYRALQTRGLSTAYMIDTVLYNSEVIDIPRVFARLRAFPSPPTAIVTWEDATAGRLLRHAVAQGVRVPEALSILGIANFPLGEYLQPALTTIEQFPEQIGRDAVSLLLQRIADGPRPDGAAPLTRRIAPQLVERGSCGPAPR